MDSKALPNSIKSSVKSVFRIVPILRNPDNSYKWVSPAEQAAAEKSIAHLGFYSKLLKGLGEQYRGKTKYPVVFQGGGSAFLLGNAKTLVTAVHLFEGAYFGREWDKVSNSPNIDDPKTFPHLRNILNHPPDFLLFDSNGRIVFDTRREGDSAEIRFFPPRAFTRKQKNNTLNSLLNIVNFDYFALTLNRNDLGTPLEIAEHAPRLEETVYTVGFPVKTQDRKRKHNAIDSDGFAIHATIGIVEGPDFIAEDLSEKERTLAKSLLLSDNDSVDGLSGGPILNASGKVVSINRGTLTDPKSNPVNGKLPFRCINPSHKNFKLMTGKYADILRQELQKVFDANQ